MSGSQRTVSVGIPVYNGGEYLCTCLESILGQTFSDFEVVAVDDCSSDESRNVIDRYAKMDDRVRVFQNSQNLGLVANWNRCVELARGQWLKFVFQDDWLAPDCLRLMVEDAGKTGALLTVCRREYVFEDVSTEFRKRYPAVGQELSPGTVFPGKGLISPVEVCNAVLDRGVINFVGEPTATLIDRDAFRRFGVFNHRLIQWCDLEYWLRLAVNQGLSYIPEPLAFFRVHQNSTTSRNFNGRSFRGDIVDPLLVRCELAYNPHFQALRDVAAVRGIDLEAEFLRASINEQSWGEEHANRGWGQAIATEPRLRMPWPLRLRRIGRNFSEKLR